MSLLTAIPAAKLWCQQITSISQITFVVSEAARRDKERANNRVQNLFLCIWERTWIIFSFCKVVCTCDSCLSYVPVYKSCQFATQKKAGLAEWAEEEGENLLWWKTIFVSCLLTRDNFFPRQETMGWGWKSFGGSRANHWHLTPPKCDGRALTNQTEIWPNFPLYIWQIYCHSLDWFLLLGHKRRGVMPERLRSAGQEAISRQFPSQTKFSTWFWQKTCLFKFLANLTWK